MADLEDITVGLEDTMEDLVALALAECIIILRWVVGCGIALLAEGVVVDACFL